MSYLETIDEYIVTQWSGCWKQPMLHKARSYSVPKVDDMMQSDRTAEVITVKAPATLIDGLSSWMSQIDMCFC